ncbi:serine/threonine protein kinase [Endozoicomonas sp. (ex Bugula neritina AB1)]|nr:serine/threonine protein kinase [Endozoicomonas sp. (ex Bugula neritina AB1)]
MAKHISFSDPVNDAERWAFQLLEKELPDDYTLLTNIEIPTHTGQTLEVDALVVGEWGVYVVDVKGYIGHLDAGQHAWSLDGRDIDNSLSKANYVARVLAGKLKHKIPVGVYAPWVQGLVFVTGRKGQDIQLEKTDSALSIYTPQQIVSALTAEWASHAPRKFPVTTKQKDHVLDTLGQVSVVERRNNRIQDFIKQKCLFIQHGLEIWLAEYSPGDWSAPWLLKMLVTSGFDSSELQYTHEQKMRDEFQRLHKLAGCNGVPYCAPLIQDGEQLVLPIKMPSGVPFSEYNINDHSTYQLLEVLRQSVRAIQNIHRRGFTVGNWTDNCTFISDNGDVEFIDISNNSTIEDDTQLYARQFLSIAMNTRQPEIYHWFKEAAEGINSDLDSLCCNLSAIIETGLCDKEQQAVLLQPEAIIDHHYRLEALIQKTDKSQFWRASHIQGQFNCAVSVYQNVDEHWQGLNALYRSLSRIIHPHVEKVMSFGLLPVGQDLFIAREWVQGCSIDELESFDVGQPSRWFAQLLTALQYLHKVGIFHGAICPRNIVCNSVRAVLVNFGVGLDIAATSYSSQYADPNFWAEESDVDKDLYGLVASFVDVFSPLQSLSQHSSKSILMALDSVDRGLMGETLFEACKLVLQFEFQTDPSMGYLEQFGLVPESLNTR